MRQARAKAQYAVEFAQQASRKERAAALEAGSAVREALFGNGPEASRFAKEALRLSDSRDVEYGAALALALSHDPSESLRLTKDLERRFPEDTEVRSSYLPSLRALLVLNAEPATAVQLLEAAASYELGMPPSSVDGFYGTLYPVYVRGLAYLSGHQGPQAAMEFQKILAHRNIVGNDPIGALAHLQLGRALVMSGDTAGAKAAYRDFLTLWKDADPEIPVLQQARGESAKLQ